MADIVMKCCTKCKQDKPLTDFYYANNRPMQPCKECKKELHRSQYVPKSPPPPPQGYKRCPRCQQVLPTTTEYFYTNRSTLSGVTSLCKVCHHEYEQARYDRPKLALPETRTCRICKQAKPATPDFFERMKANNYGLNTICKACAAAARYKPSPYEPAPPGYKRCRQCLEAKPATPEFFRADNQAKDGLRNQCRECRKAYRRKPLPYKPRKRKPVPAGDKQCIVCKQFFPRTKEYFFYARHAVDRLQSSCKKCYGKQGMDRWRAHPVEERSRKSREYYQSHKEAIKANNLRYQHSPKGRLTLRTATLNRIARKKAVQGSYTSAQIEEQLKRQKYRCYYAACGHAKFPRVKKNGKWRYTYHVEHTFPLSRVAGTDIPANDIGYLVLACVHCNGSKGSKFPWEWPEGGRLL